MVNKLILQIPRFFIAPDGTLLWPRIMNCGCKLVENHLAQDDHIDVIVDACEEHYDKAYSGAAMNDDTLTKFVITDDETMPVITTSDLY